MTSEPQMKSAREIAIIRGIQVFPVNMHSLVLPASNQPRTSLEQLSQLAVKARNHPNVHQRGGLRWSPTSVAFARSRAKPSQAFVTTFQRAPGSTEWICWTIFYYGPLAYMPV